MTTEFRVTLENRPGTLAEVADVMGKANILITAGAGLGLKDMGLLYVVVDNPDGARRAFDQAGIKYNEREVLTLTLPHKPGQLARLAAAMASAGINIDAVYPTMTGKVILAAADLEGARAVARSLDML